MSALSSVWEGPLEALEGFSLPQAAPWCPGHLRQNSWNLMPQWVVGVGLSPQIDSLHAYSSNLPAPTSTSFLSTPPSTQAAT